MKRGDAFQDILAFLLTLIIIAILVKAYFLKYPYDPKDTQYESKDTERCYDCYEPYIPGVEYQGY